MHSFIILSMKSESFVDVTSSVRSKVRPQTAAKSHGNLNLLVIDYDLSYFSRKQSSKIRYILVKFLNSRLILSKVTTIG
jgi:hypothetical protein